MQQKVSNPISSAGLGAVRRRIRDSVHGTVDVSALEDRVIHHPIFQRLRRLRQTAFLNFVFPGATHTRFEHSLGVMHLAGTAWERMRVNQQVLLDRLSQYRDFERREYSVRAGEALHGLLAPTIGASQEIFSSSYTLQALRLAALLHDVGHPPFSHSGERFLPSWDAVYQARSQLPSYLQDFVQRRTEELGRRLRSPKDIIVSHEFYSLALVDRILEDIRRDLTRTGAIGGDADIEFVEPQDVVAILRPDVPTRPGSPLARLGAARLCHELVSGEFDVDRMDYLLRDSRECGVVYGVFDASRVLDSLVLYARPRKAGSTDEPELHLAIMFSGLAAFEDYLHARHSMYLQVYFHKTDVACEAMLQELKQRLGPWTLPVDLDRYIALDEYNIRDHLRQAAVDAIGDGEALRSFQTLLDELVLHRRLWKRVYEVTGEPGPQPTDSLIAWVENMLRKEGVPFQTVSSAASLTRFRPRAKDEPSPNYLRLIKRDETQFPRVYPIEDYSQAIASNSNIKIRRIYVEDRIGDDGVSVARRVRNQLASGFEAP